MNNLDRRLDRLIAAAREAAVDEVVSAPAGAWVTRVGALGLAEMRRSRAGSALLAWAMPGFGVAMLVAILAIVAWGPVIKQSEGNAGLVALADPLASNSLLP
jgi:hypothetical protein